MKPARILSAVAVALAGLALAAPPARAGTVFSEDFEADLSKWATAGSAKIVADPLDPGNHVISFNSAVQAGDLFSDPILVAPGTTYYLSFDYMGTDVGPTFLGGGAIGYSSTFLAVAEPTYGIAVHPVKDGLWHHYEIAFTPSTSSIQVMVEDFIGTGNNPGQGTAKDDFFDNIVVSDTPAQVAGVPEPGTAAALALGALALLRRRGAGKRT